MYSVDDIFFNLDVTEDEVDFSVPSPVNLLPASLKRSVFPAANTSTAAAANKTLKVISCLTLC